MSTSSGLSTDNMQVLIPTHNHPGLLEKCNPTVMLEARQCKRLLDTQKHQLSDTWSKVNQVHFSTYPVAMWLLCIISESVHHYVDYRLVRAW
jgi:hypothetical protein